MGVFEFTFVALLVTNRAKAELLMWFSLFLVFGSVSVLFLKFTFVALLVLMRTTARDLLVPFSTPLVLRSRSASKD